MSQFQLKIISGQVMWKLILPLLVVLTLSVADEEQGLSEASHNKVDLYASERTYEEQELGARFDPVTGKRRYDKYEVVKVKPVSDEQLQVLKFLEKGMVELWNPLPANFSLIDSVDILVSPEHASHVKKYLQCSGMDPETMIQDLQKEIDQENVPSGETEDDGLVGRPETFNPFLYQGHHLERRGTFGDFLKSVLGSDTNPPPSAVRAGRNLNFPKNGPYPLNLPYAEDKSRYCFTRTGMTWSQYHRLSTMDQYMDCLIADHRDKVEVIEIGRSSEGRPLRVLKLGHPTKIIKPAIWVDGGIHAREWVSPASVLYAVRELVENEDPNNSVLNTFDIYVLPVANPDGYEYSHEVDRMWRKTRSANNGACIGVDPNRNWGFRWGGEGASTSPCSETYRGPRPFSEPETAAIRDFIMARNNQIKLYLTFHSFGQYVLYPWGYATIDSEDVHDLHAMGVEAANAISRASGRSYSVGSASKMLYPAAGGSDDWAKGGAGIKYSYTIELPDRGQHGFILPASNIESVGKEAHAAIVAMLKVLQ